MIVVLNVIRQMAALRAHRNAPRTFNEQIAILKSQQGAVARLMFHPVDDFLVHSQKDFKFFIDLLLFSCFVWKDFC